MQCALFRSVYPWIVKKLDKKLVLACDIFTNQVGNYDITKSSKPARLATIFSNSILKG